MNIAVFVSGNGSNLQALIEAGKKGLLGEQAEIGLVVSDQPDSFAVQRALKAGIKVFVRKVPDGCSREEYDKVILETLRDEGIALVVLAGFMRILSPAFISSYKGRILNIHPALLPSFKGTHGIRDAFDYGVKVTGVTVHFVEDELDAGPIIMQSAVPVEREDTLETLEKKIHEEEHRLYPEAVRLFVEGKLVLNGRKVNILE